MAEETEVVTPEPVEQEPVASEEAPPERPEFVPEKFWDADNNSANVEAMGQAYTELERFVGKKRDEIREDVINQYNQELNENRPESVDGYTIQFPDDHPLAEIQDQIDTEDDPLLTMWKETAYKAGLSNEEYMQGIETWIAASQAAVSDREDVSSDLGENGNARIEAVEMWAARNLEEAEYEALASAVTNTEAFLAIEKLMSSSKSKGNQGQYTEDSVTSRPTREELNQAMNDPRYWDPAKRDLTYVRQVENMTKRMTG